VSTIVENKKGLPPTHPGELLREELMPAIGLTQEALADGLAYLGEQSMRFWAKSARLVRTWLTG